MTNLLTNACWLLLKDRFLGIRTEEELKLWLGIQRQQHPVQTAPYTFDLQTRAGWEEVITYVLKTPRKLPLIDMQDDTIYVNGWGVLEVDLRVGEGEFEICKLNWLDPDVGRRVLYDAIEHLEREGEIEFISDHSALMSAIWYLYHGGDYGK